MAQFKRKKKRTFGKLPVSVQAKNTEWWINEGAPRLIEEAAKKREAKGWDRGDTRGVW